jgi:hypothetical protein
MRAVKLECTQRERDIDLGYQEDPLTCPETLVILDDCIDSNLFSFRGTVDKIAERGRHINLSGVVSSQRISAISRSIRINSDIFLIFCPYQARELEQFVEQFVFRDQRKAIYETMREIFDVPYRFLFVDNLEKNMRKKLKTSIAQDFIKDKYRTLDLELVDIKYKAPGQKRKRKVEEEEDADDFY